jgi:hypothetical protein
MRAGLANPLLCHGALVSGLYLHRFPSGRNTPATTPSFRKVSADAGEIDWEKIAIGFKLGGKGLV